MRGVRVVWSQFRTTHVRVRECCQPVRCPPAKSWPPGEVSLAAQQIGAPVMRAWFLIFFYAGWSGKSLTDLPRTGSSLIAVTPTLCPSCIPPGSMAPASGQAPNPGMTSYRLWIIQRASPHQTAKHPGRPGRAGPTAVPFAGHGEDVAAGASASCPALR
jgi:hypothetical protein